MLQAGTLPEARPGPCAETRCPPTSAASARRRVGAGIVLVVLARKVAGRARDCDHPRADADPHPGIPERVVAEVGRIERERTQRLHGRAVGAERNVNERKAAHLTTDAQRCGIETQAVLRRLRVRTTERQAPVEHCSGAFVVARTGKTWRRRRDLSPTWRTQDHRECNN